LASLAKIRSLLKSILVFVILVTAVGLAVDTFRFKQTGLTSLSDKTLDLFTKQLSDGQRQRFNRGQPMLVYVWATWCGFCKITSPAVNSIGDDYPVATIVLKSGGGAKVARFLKQHGYSFNYFNDYDGALTRSLNISVTPTFLIINNTGEIKFMSVGMTTEVSLRAKLSVF